MRSPALGIDGLRRFHARREMLAVLAVVTISVAFACSGPAKQNNANASVTSASKPVNNNASSQAPSSQADVNIREPDRYSVAMTISAQETASEAPTPMSTLQYSFSRFDADRRWAFTLSPPLGQVVYLEKSGLKYLVLLGSKQYVELMSDALGFQVGTALSPISFPQQAQSRLSFERIGPQPINGRTAIEHRIRSGTESSTQTEGLIFVDQETGLPLRSEVTTTQPDGKKWRVMVELREIQLNPDRTQFDVPGGLKKVTGQEAKQQMLGFVGALRPFAELISGAPPSANSGQPASKNK